MMGRKAKKFYGMALGFGRWLRRIKWGDGGLI